MLILVILVIHFSTDIIRNSFTRKLMVHETVLPDDIYLSIINEPAMETPETMCE